MTKTQLKLSNKLQIRTTSTIFQKLLKEVFSIKMALK